METLITIGVCIGLLIGLPILILVIRDKLDQGRWQCWSDEHPEWEVGTPQYEARFDTPDFAALEKRLGQPLPQSYKDAYLRGEIVRESEFVLLPPSAQEFEDSHHVNHFYPADKLTVEADWAANYFAEGWLVLGNNGFGGEYYLPLSEATHEDCPVYYYHYDGDIKFKVADSLSEFLSWRRVGDAEWDS